MAGAKFEIKGEKDVELNLNRAIAGITGNTAKGISLAGQFIKGEAQSLTSIDEGNLIRTAFSKDVKTSEGHATVVGYTADYAAAVHEMPADTNWNRPGAENEFLVKAVMRNLSAIVNLITNIARRNP